MEQKRDIENAADIKVFVDSFYDKIKKDDLLAPIFFEKIPDDWSLHLQRMYLFWNAAIFGEKGYIGNPFAKHATLKVTFLHFDRWLVLFNETIDRHFEGDLAENAKWRAAVMAENFMRRLDDLNHNSKTVLV